MQEILDSRTDNDSTVACLSIHMQRVVFRQLTIKNLFGSWIQYNYYIKIKFYTKNLNSNLLLSRTAVLKTILGLVWYRSPFLPTLCHSFSFRMYVFLPIYIFNNSILRRWPTRLFFPTPKKFLNNSLCIPLFSLCLCKIASLPQLFSNCNNISLKF